MFHNAWTCVTHAIISRDDASAPNTVSTAEKVPFTVILRGMMRESESKPRNRTYRLGTIYGDWRAVLTEKFMKKPILLWRFCADTDTDVDVQSLLPDVCPKTQ